MHLQKQISRAVRKVLDMKSLFQCSCNEAGASVVTFEVDWDQIRGIDYSSPLLEDSRLVLEIKGIIRREFPVVRLGHHL